MTVVENLRRAALALAALSADEQARKRTEREKEYQQRRQDQEADQRRREEKKRFQKAIDKLVPKPPKTT